MVSWGFADGKPCCQALGASFCWIQFIWLMKSEWLFKFPRWNQRKCLSNYLVEENDQNVFLTVVCIPLLSGKLTRKLRTKHRAGQLAFRFVSPAEWPDVRCALSFSGFLGLILQLRSPDKAKEKCSDGISLDFWSIVTKLVLGVIILALWVFLPKVVQL